MDSSSSRARKKKPDDVLSSQPQCPTASLVCLKNWWMALQVLYGLRRINNTFSYKCTDKVHSLRFLTKAEEFRNEFGDFAVPIYVHRPPIPGREQTEVSNDDFQSRHLLQIPHSMGFWSCVGWTAIVLFVGGLCHLDLLDTFLGCAAAFNPLNPLLEFYRLWLQRRVVIREPLPGQPRVIPNAILINGLTAADCTVPAVGINGNIRTHHQAMHAPSAAPRNQKRLIPTRAEALAGDYPDEPGVRGFRPLRPADENAIYAGVVATVNIALTPEQGLSLLRGVVAFHVHRVRNTGVNQGAVGALNPNLCATHSAHISLHVGYNRALNHPLVIQMLDDLCQIAQDFHLIILAANMTAVTNRYNRMRNRHTPAVVDAPGHFN